MLVQLTGFIRGPFLIEGILIGLSAALFTVFLLGLAYDSIIVKLSSTDVLKKMKIVLMSFSEFSNIVVIVFLILGIGIGIVGSSISMKKYLEV